jgi:transcriptional regulator with XRE-family HTH domain
LGYPYPDDLLLQVEKSIYSEDYQRLTALLRQLRLDVGLKQTELAERLGEHQSFVSKYEAGERRLDLVELRMICAELGTPLVELIARWDSSATS